MAFASSTNEILARLAEAVETNLATGWVAEPPAARLALLIREELAQWTRRTYPGSTCDLGTLEADSRRHLTLTIHSAPVTHRVEIWGMACGDEREGCLPAGAHLGHSWVVLAHLGNSCKNADAASEKIASFGLRQAERRQSARLSLSLWMGNAAPDGCPACLSQK